MAAMASGLISTGGIIGINPSFTSVSKAKRARANSSNAPAPQLPRDTQMAPTSGAAPKSEASVSPSSNQTPAPQQSQPPKRRRSFQLPYAPSGQPDIIDAIMEQGGIKAHSR